MTAPLLASLALVLLAVLPARAQEPAPHPTQAAGPRHDDAAADRVIAEVRRATARYVDIAHARTDGYVQMSGMEARHGYHFVRADAQALTTAAGLATMTLDLARPPVLVYIRDDEGGPGCAGVGAPCPTNGTWQLVGVEYVLPRAPTSGPLPLSAWGSHEASCHYRDWQEVAAARSAECPARHPASGAPLVSWHPAFAVAHVWAWYPNPDGPFARENRYLDAWGRGIASGAAGHHHARNAAEIAYSELNHRVAGSFLVVLAALAAFCVVRPRARVAAAVAAVVWIVFGAYLVVSADPEAWPLGGERFRDVFSDTLVLQHKLLALIPVGIGIVEVARAAGHGVAIAWVVPALAIAGGIGLFFHDHEGGLHLDRTFVQHAVMGAAGVGVGGALLAMGRRRRWGASLAWAWPTLLGVTAAVLLFYTE